MSRCGTKPYITVWLWCCMLAFHIDCTAVLHVQQGLKLQHYCPSQAIRQTHRKEGQQQSQMMFAAHGCRKATRSCTNYVIGISSSHVKQGLHQYGIYFSGLSNFRTQQPCRMCMQCCTVICNGIELHSVYWWAPCKLYSRYCTYTVCVHTTSKTPLASLLSKNIILDNMMNVCLASRAQQQCIDAQYHLVQLITCCYYMYKFRTIFTQDKVPDRWCHVDSMRTWLKTGWGSCIHLQTALCLAFKVRLPSRWGSTEAHQCML